MKNSIDLICSIVVAVLAWVAYKYLGAIWALVVLIAATITFIWWNARRNSDRE